VNSDERKVGNRGHKDNVEYNGHKIDAVSNPIPTSACLIEKKNADCNKVDGDAGG